MMQGDFPSTKAALVTAWAIIHKDALLKNWNVLGGTRRQIIYQGVL